MKDNISSRMFDLRPMKEEGNLDLARIKKVREFLDLREERWKRKKTKKKAKKNNLGSRSKRKMPTSDSLNSSFDHGISLEALEKALNQVAPPGPEENSFGPIKILYSDRREIIRIFEETTLPENNFQDQEEKIPDALVREILSENQEPKILAGDEKENSVGSEFIEIKEEPILFSSAVSKKRLFLSSRA